MKAARFADSSRAEVGDVVLAVGYPHGLASSVTKGIISATGRAIAELGRQGWPGTTLSGAVQASAPSTRVRSPW